MAIVAMATNCRWKRRQVTNAVSGDDYVNGDNIVASVDKPLQDAQSMWHG